MVLGRREFGRITLMTFENGRFAAKCGGSMAVSCAHRVDSRAVRCAAMSKLAQDRIFQHGSTDCLDGRAIWRLEGAGIKHRVDEWKVTETIIGSCDCVALISTSIAGGAQVGEARPVPPAIRLQNRPSIVNDALPLTVATMPLDAWEMGPI